MKPGNIMEFKNGIDIRGGYNCSLLRNWNGDCVICHQRIDAIATVIDYFLIRTSTGYKAYSIYKRGDKSDIGDEIPLKRFFKLFDYLIFEIKTETIYDKKEFDLAKQKAIIEEL